MRFWAVAITGFLLLVLETLLALAMSGSLMGTPNSYWARQHFVLLNAGTLSTMSLSVAAYFALLSYVDRE